MEPEAAKSFDGELLTAERGATTQLAFRTWYESGWGWPLVEFGGTFGLWAVAFAAGLANDQWLFRAALVPPLTLLSGRLFTLAHDAGHGSFSTSRTVNAVVGRLSLVPSAHVFGLWRVHHDVHHRYANLRQRDFVWTPLSASEYRALTRRRRLLHRVYRNPSGLGLGLHYTIEIWAPRMLWPRGCHALPHRARLHRDAALHYALLVGLALSAWWFVSVVDSDRATDARGWVSAVVLLLLLPLIGTHWLIGFVIFLNHTHPDIVWYDNPAEWSRNQVQLEGSAGVRFDRISHLLLPRRIMNHTVHHLDPGVPLRSLESAQQGLVGQHADVVISWDWSPRRFGEILARCKLYDYEAQRWLTYAEAEEQA